MRILRLYLVIIIASSAFVSCHNKDTKLSGNFGDSLYLADVPPQPGEDTWKFVEDLKSPMWTKHPWNKKEAPEDHADLSRGVIILENFPDNGGSLATAYDDLKNFLSAGGVETGTGEFTVSTEQNKEFGEESFQIDISRDSCRITAGDADGIRRGIFYAEDLMLSLRGPFLPFGSIKKEPVIKRRISRCFFGPIKRAPKMRDELMDDVDYYPEQYLNRLAHEGVNGLWLTIEFRDLVATRFTPGNGKDAAKRLAKLKQTVDKCLKYGIRTYIFCIEPRAWEAGSPVLEAHPVLGGAPAGKGFYFCPMSTDAHDYLYESVNKIFSAVPGLGGMINISHGERGTTCLSAVSSTSDYEGAVKCPRCSGKEPWEILNASLSAMEEGMHDADPGAELISWQYMPSPQRYVTGDPYGIADWVYDLPAHAPENVILQFNFESGVSRTEFGKLLVGGDYWISNPGPSERYEGIARVAREHGAKLSAKIQTGNSHEVATVPYVPMPALLYKKFTAMRKLGVSHTMLCWYFGNYPGLMNKSAGMLSMEPFPEDAGTFLQQLASIYWKKEDVPKVVEAWKLFAEGYENYPLTNLFQYYGPIHDGPVWPLTLKPADAPLSPTWQIGSSTTLKPWPPSGDRVGECIGDVLTLDEVVELARRMTASYSKGMEIFAKLKYKYSDEPERLLEIGINDALGIQLKSGYNILKFYLLREKMFRMEGPERFGILKEMIDIINEEIRLDEELLVLCENDSRLGFHSEAEGYKYYPAKIRWRMAKLHAVLENDVPELKMIIKADQPLFPEYTGLKPRGAIAASIPSGDIFAGAEPLPGSIEWQSFEYGKGKTMQWSSTYDSDAIYFIVAENTDSLKEASALNIEVKIEPARLHPAAHYIFSNDLSDTDPVHIPGYPLIFRAGYKSFSKDGKRFTISRIPLKNIGLLNGDMHPLRVDVRVRNNHGGSCSWRPDNPLTPRLILGSDNPADPGWLIFKN